MGCDIHIHAEKKSAKGYKRVIFGDEFEPFSDRDYGTFGFLADVRNYSAVPPLAPQRGMPEDVSAATKEDFDGWGSDAHSASWLSLSELLAFDYDTAMEDRRCVRRRPDGVLDGGSTCDPGEGKAVTYREFLGRRFFRDLDRLKSVGADRVVFWFDN